MMAVVEGRGEFRDIRCEKFTKVEPAGVVAYKG